MLIGVPNFGQNPLGHQAQFPHSANSNIPVLQTRSLPAAKAWAANLPTLLTHNGFELMCRPNINSDITSQCPNLYYTYSQLERFLGSTLMRRHFHKTIEEPTTNVNE